MGGVCILCMGDMLTCHNDELHSSCAAVTSSEMVAIFYILIATSLKIKFFWDVRRCRLASTFE